MDVTPAHQYSLSFAHTRFWFLHSDLNVTATRVTSSFCFVDFQRRIVLHAILAIVSAKLDWRLLFVHSSAGAGACACCACVPVYLSLWFPFYLINLLTYITVTLLCASHVLIERMHRKRDSIKSSQISNCCVNTISILTLKAEIRSPDENIRIRNASKFKTRRDNGCLSHRLRLVNAGEQQWTHQLQLSLSI